MPEPTASQRRRQREQAVEEYHRQLASRENGLVIRRLEPADLDALEAARQRRLASPVGDQTLPGRRPAPTRRP